MTAPIINTLKFMVDGVVGVAGGQKLKKMAMIKYTTAPVFTAIPRKPGILKGPQDNAFAVVNPIGLAVSSGTSRICPLHRR